MYYQNNQPPHDRQVLGNQYGQVPPQGGRSGDFQNGGFQPKKKKRRGFAWQILKLLLVLILVAAVGAGIYVGKAYLDVKAYTSVFLDGITVDGIDLGGMTWEEGNAAVRDQIVLKLGSWYVRLKSSNGSYGDITAETLGISRDPAEALEAAWAVGHETSTANRKTIFELQQVILSTRDNPYGFSSVEYDADTTKIDGILSKLESKAYIAPQDAQLLTFNPDSTTEPFTFQQEVVGRRLNIAPIKERILEMISTFESGEILLAPETLSPEITVADLDQYYALRARAVTPVDTTSPDERNENIRIAFSKINGYVLNNGAKFSFNGVVGRRTQANGFYRAYEYNYGDLVFGIGGGVCQASSTVYLAAMKAGMDLLDHTSHAMKVSYTDLGMDATVTDTVGAEKDMSFRNDSGGQIFIAAQVLTDPANRKRLLCEVRIYGMDLGDISYNLETEIVQVLQPPAEPEYIEDKEALYVTYIDEYKIVSEAAVGYVVDTYLVTLQNGVQIAREKITRSTYGARATKVYTGVTPRQLN
ncbi:MAG: VanW family protein [Bacillota bacterium]